MAFLPPAQQDEAWSRVVAALVAGKLGPAAKTPPPDPPGGGGGAGPRTAVLIVYTNDWEDREDVLRVGLALRQIARVNQLSYKTDECVVC